MSKTDALIMAAGKGRRFGKEAPKQFVALGGRPMIAWSIERFERAVTIDAIVVVVSPGDDDRVREIVEATKATKVRHIVHGGETRQQSVWLGLQAIEGQRVLVHDAARACLTETLLERIASALDEHDAVVPVVPAVDTLVLEREGQLDALMDRANVARVQTPQGFRTELLARAHRRAQKEGLIASDEGSLVFSMGAPVRTVPGERTNIKITFEEDFRIAEAILKLQSLD